jgi:hypothetical protein
MNLPHKILKLYTLLLTSALLFFFTEKIIVACAGGDEEDVLDYSAFAPEIIEQPKYSPYFFTYDETYPADPSYTPSSSDDYNINEWYQFFDEKITKEDLNWFVYGSTPAQLEGIHISLWEKAKLHDTIQQKSLINLRLKDEMGEIIKYLTLSKNAEPIFNQNTYDWYEPIKHDSIGAIGFQKEFLRGFIRSKSLFLKYRYGFQLIRAYFFSNQFQKAVNVWSLMPALTAKNGSIYYRCLGYKAAALYRLKLYEESNLIYAQLYDEYEPQQMSAYRSFHLLEDSIWTHNISLAKTTRQKENLWQLYGIYANPLKAMHHIYEINPKSDLIPLLMVRNVNIIETANLRYSKATYANEASWNYGYYQKEPFIDSSLFIANWDFDYSNKQKVLQVLHRIINERKVPAITPYLVSAAYLHALSKQYDEANKCCKEVLKLSSNALVINQTEIIKAFILVMQLNKIEASNELEIEKQLNKIVALKPSASRAENAVNYIMFILSQKYAAQGNLIKSELCYPSSLTYYRNSDDAEAMLKFMEQAQHNSLENLLLARYPLKLENVYQIKATRLLYEYRFEEALVLFEKINTVENLYADPFTMRLVDCHDCDFSATQDIKYTHQSFVKKMIALKLSFETEKNKETLSHNLFLFANALYNMTYFGNGRFIAKTPISWMENDYPGDVKEEAKTHQFYYDCSEALTYYNKARSITNDKEFAAQCAWAAAKCEHNLKLTGGMPWQTEQAADFEAGTYFLEMKTKYATTKYYKEVLNDCGYFCTYITKDTTCIRDKWSLRNR